MKQNYKSTILLLLLSLIGSGGIAEPLKKNKPEASEATNEQHQNQTEEFYLQVLQRTPDHLDSNMRLGSLYLSINQPDKSVAYLKKAVNVSKTYSQDLNQQLGLAYQLSADYDNAITIYYGLIMREKKNSTQTAVYQKKITECISGKQLMASPLKVKVSNMGSLVNSASVDHVPVLTANDQTMLFTSQRSKDNKNPTVPADEDVFQINRQEATWSAPTRLSQPFNTNHHEAILAVSPSGNKMYMYSNKHGKGDIYEIQKEGNNAWKAPEKLGGSINTRHQELSFIVSADGNFAFFSSDRPGGFGGLDLYMSIADGHGNWSEAINMGANINTAYDEDAPFLSADNNVLYFSSKGHSSIGGYDIFKSTINGAVWSLAQNIGVPVNSPYDEAFYVQTQDGRTAYFSSDRPGGFGASDIYVVEAAEILVAEVPEVTGPYTAMTGEDDLAAIMPALLNTTMAPAKQTRLVKGYVIDAQSRDTLQARITLLNKSLYTTEVVIETTPEGYYEIELANSNDYGLLIERDGYQVRSENLPTLAEAKEQILTYQTLLQKDSLTAQIALQNIQFYPNQDLIKSYSLAELDWLYTYLLDNPLVDAIISDYHQLTDTVADKKKLNQQRVNSIVKYLNAKGLEPGRVQYKALKNNSQSAKTLAAGGILLNLERTE